MRRTTTLLTMLTVVGAFAAAPLAAQQEEELDRRIRELRRELRRLEAERGDRWGATVDNFFPRVMNFSTSRANLGVTVRISANEETDDIGALLQAVNADGPADEAGLRAGDIITRFNGEPLVGGRRSGRSDESEPAARLIEMVRAMDEGDEVQIEYQRGGDTATATVTLRRVDPENLWFGGVVGGPDVRFRGSRIADQGFGRVEVFGQGDFMVFSTPWWDIELVALNEGLGRYFGTTDGLLVITPPDEIDGLDLQAGDVILSIDGREPQTPSRALRILRSYEEGETVTFTIVRDRQERTVSVDLPERTNPLRRRNRSF